jgi:ribosome-associated protein
MNSGFIRVTPQLVIPHSEISFRSSRSGGPGGQNVNKVESRVELIFDVNNSPSLTNQQRSKISLALKNKMDSNGILHLTSQRSRSQWENKEIVITEFSRLLKIAVKPGKKRIHTHPSKADREKWLKEKKVISEKKRTRRSFELD